MTKVNLILFENVCFGENAYLKQIFPISYSDVAEASAILAERQIPGPLNNDNPIGLDQGTGS